MVLKSRKSKLIAKYATYVGAIVLVVTASTAFLSYRIFNAKLIAERTKFERQIEQNNEQLKKYEKSTRTGWILVNDKKAGDVIGSKDVQQIKLPDHFTPTNVISSDKDVIGKVIKISSLKTTYVTEEMIYENGRLEDSERKEEIEYVKLPIKLQKEDTVDIRIVFPNGEDYIVLAKKKVTDLDKENQLAFFNDNEEEALMMQSALVDAYINNAELYMKIYVEPEMQDKPIPNYVPNKAVIDLMQSNPLIVKKARTELAKQLRDSLDRRLDAIDPADSIRVGADAPTGSAVSKNKHSDGASIKKVPSNTSTGINQGVNDIVSSSAETGSPKVLQPNPVVDSSVSNESQVQTVKPNTGDGNSPVTTNMEKQEKPNSSQKKGNEQSVTQTNSDSSNSGGTVPNLLGGE